MERTILAALALIATALGYGLSDSATAMDGNPDQAQAQVQAQETADTGAPVVGDRLAEDAHLIADPGRYGLGPSLPGTRYAIADGWLLRVDATSLTVQSRLWQRDLLD